MKDVRSVDVRVDQKAPSSADEWVVVSAVVRVVLRDAC